MFRLLTPVCLSLAILASPSFADDVADFRSALQVTFPATVAVTPQGQADGQVANDALQQWQQNAFRGGMFGGMGLQGMPPMVASTTVRAGFAVNANHVLTQLDDGRNEITVTTIDNVQHNAKVVARDNVTGLCVAKVDGVDLVSLVVGDGYPETGLPVATTWIEDGVRRCKQGMISSPLNSSHPQIGMTQHLDFNNDSVVTGSPIIDSAGVLVGVTVQGDDGSIVCLPATQLNRLIDTALGDAPKDLERGLVGVAFSGDDGSVVASVTDGSPAAKAGLEPGDRVTQIDDHVIDSSKDVIAAVAMARAGDSVKVTVQRGDETETYTLTLGQHPQQRITLSPLRENQDDNGAIVRQEGWQLKDGKLVPLDLDADGNFDMVLPQEFQEMFKNGPNALPNQFRMPRRFQGLRVERSDTEEAIRKLETERDEQEAKIKELTEKIQELEKKK
ncbi:MAG: PDZ domain-containing protein [Pirellulaceae bacterium]